MPVSIVQSGVWKSVPRLWVVVGGAWREVSNGWVVVGGVWRKFHSSLSATLSPVDVTRTITGGSSSNQQIRVDTDGFVYRASSSPTSNNVQLYQWRTGGGTSADYTVGYVSLAAGTTPSSGPAVNVFNNLGSSVTWANNQAGGGFASKTSTLNVQIRKASDGTVLASTTFKLTAAVEP